MWGEAAESRRGGTGRGEQSPTRERAASITKAGTAAGRSGGCREVVPFQGSDPKRGTTVGFGSGKLRLTGILVPKYLIALFSNEAREIVSLSIYIGKAR